MILLFFSYKAKNIINYNKYHKSNTSCCILLCSNGVISIYSIYIRIDRMAGISVHNISGIHHVASRHSSAVSVNVLFSSACPWLCVQGHGLHGDWLSERLAVILCTLTSG